MEKKVKKVLPKTNVFVTGDVATLFWREWKKTPLHLREKKLKLLYTCLRNAVNDERAFLILLNSYLTDLEWYLESQALKRVFKKNKKVKK